MGTFLRRILRWTGNNATTSIFCPGYNFSMQYTGCRFLSSNDQTASVAAQHNQNVCRPKLELSVSSLVDMGFSDVQARRLYDSMPSVRGGKAAEQVVSTLTALFLLGLNPCRVLYVLGKCPKLYTVEETQLQKRIVYLRKLGLLDGGLQSLVARYPEILTVPTKSIKLVVQFLKEKCLFTTQQTAKILTESPTVLLEDQDHLEYKFQYVYFRMGIKQNKMVKSKLFSHTLEDLQNRHTFLERRGLYQVPDKKGQTSIINPRLERILQADQDTFVTRIAKASMEEYEVFLRLLARELREEGLNYCIEAYGEEVVSSDDNDYEEEDGSDDDDYEEEDGSDDDDYEEDGSDDDDYEEEEEEEVEGKSGYEKKKKYGSKRT